MPMHKSKPSDISVKARKTQVQRREETRLKLVQGAVELLKKKRYAGFRVAEVATVSGVSRGAQSHYFPLKDDLVIEALEFVFKETQKNADKR
jgi:AcrR family transcriptional regulator